MIIHYLKISLRNIRKYKTQTAISICAMAVSIMLLAIVGSFLLSFKPTPLLSQPYVDRVEKFSYGDRSQSVSFEEVSLIMGHHVKSLEEIHFIPILRSINMATSSFGSDKERSLICYSRRVDSEYPKFVGMKSVYSGDEIGPISDSEVVITEWLAKKLFGDANPIGKSIDLHFYHNDVYNESDKSYVVKDVMENPSPNNRFIDRDDILLAENHLIPKSSKMECYLVLRDGVSRDTLAKELNGILSGGDVKLINVKNSYDEYWSIIICNCLILFLFLFVLVSFSNYLRQQTQLFRLREREVALRTCVGAKPASMFCLFSSEIFIVLSLTLALALTLISIVTGFLMSRYVAFLESENFSFSDAIPVAIVSTSILMAISMVVVALTIRRIRLDQTGFALRMRPRPKHRLRNVGLTVQMTGCIFFLCVTVVLCMSIQIVKDYFGIPDDMDRYRRCISVRLNGIPEKEARAIYDKIESLESVERVFKLMDFRTSYPFDEEYKDYLVYSEFYQSGEDVVDFYKLKYKNMPEPVNPDKNILVSEEFKQKLIDKNLWNGKTVNLPDIGEYEVKGVFDKFPFLKAGNRDAVVVYDVSHPYQAVYDHIILPKVGMEKETGEAIEDVIRNEIPARIDIKPTSFYKYIAAEYDVITAFFTIIYILSGISVVTTIAGIYAGVSLDTRRRRKEMALRKLNGAGRKVIAMIFLRTYIGIIVVAMLLSLPLCFIAFDEVIFIITPGLNSVNVALAYLVAFMLVIAVTTCTIAWKIRNIMNVDPVEYLKD